MSSLQKQLNKMAGDLITAVSADDKDKPVALKDKIDVFKATSTWYLGLKKKGSGDDPTDDETASAPRTFDKLRTMVNGATKQ